MLRLLTVCLLGAFSALYLTSIIPPSFGPVWRGIALMKKNMNFLGLGTAAYSVVSVFFVPFIDNHDSDLILDLVAHVFLIVMALPYMINFLEEKGKRFVPEAIINEFRSGFVGWVMQREKTVGIIGGVLAFLMFLATVGLFNFEIVGPPQ